MKVNLLICTPVHSELKVEYVKGLIALINTANEREVSVTTYFPKGSAIHQQRNWGLAIFMQDTALTHLLYIDSDIAFTPDNVFRLLAHDKPFSGIAYRSKGNMIGYNVYAQSPIVRCPKTGMVKVTGLGGGFMLLKKSVVEKMMQSYQELKCLGFPRMAPGQEKLNKYYYNLFDWGVNEETNYILSEDFTFCHRWRKIGGEVWVDDKQELGHVGDTRHSGKLEDNIVNGKIVVRVGQGS